MARVDGYRFGRVVVDGDEHTRDLIVLPDRTVPSWWREEGHRLVPNDLAAVADELPSTLVVGTGAQEQMRVDPETVLFLRERGVRLEALPTSDAVRRYGELDPSSTALAAHLTC